MTGLAVPPGKRNPDGEQCFRHTRRGDPCKGRVVAHVQLYTRDGYKQFPMCATHALPHDLLGDRVTWEVEPS